MPTFVPHAFVPAMYYPFHGLPAVNTAPCMSHLHMQNVSCAKQQMDQTNRL